MTNPHKQQHRTRRVAASVALLLTAPAAFALWACTGDDDVFRPTDAGAFEASSVDRAAPSPTEGGTPTLACGDAGGAPPRVLLVQGGLRQGELAALNLSTKSVDGRLIYDGGYGVTSSLGSDPYFLGGESDLVTRLDAREPWKPVASWDVRGDDVTDGGFPNANPVAIVPTSCSKAYVLRFNRNKIAIIDQSSPKGGTPKAYIDLTPLRLSGDPNLVEMTSAVYVPSKKRVFVLLGNSDLSRTVKVNGPFGEETKLLCVASLKPSIIAIDVDTDQIVNLGGTAPLGGIALEGYNPPLGTPLIYDAANDRLLVLHAGCNEDVGDGGPGNIIRRRVEQVDLATGAVKTLLSLDNKGFPSSLAYVNGENAAVAFYFDGYKWDPTKNVLGPAIAGGMDIIVRDRSGFAGTRTTMLSDGGFALEVVTLATAPDAGSAVVSGSPFARSGGYVSGVETWPLP
jgi:hypothetical protein